MRQEEDQKFLLSCQRKELLRRKGWSLKIVESLRKKSKEAWSKGWFHRMDSLAYWTEVISEKGGVVKAVEEWLGGDLEAGEPDGVCRLPWNALLKGSSALEGDYTATWHQVSWFFPFNMWVFLWTNGIGTMNGRDKVSEFVIAAGIHSTRKRVDLKQKPWLLVQQTCKYGRIHKYIWFLINLVVRKW